MALLALVLTSPAAIAPRAGLPVVHANDNRRPAGVLRRDTLHLTLAISRAVWRPESDSGPSVTVEAFAEAGKVPEIPGPLIRVVEGTVIDVTVRNALGDSTVYLHGLVTRPATGRDSLVVTPGATRRARFLAGAAGTYFYHAVVGNQSPASEREQLAGALVVDPPGPHPDDRIFVINIWGQAVDSLTYPNALAINGKSFPFDEQVMATVGDTVRWRWINASVRGHPMHLHGFFFTVTRKGDAYADTAYSSHRLRTVVTENMEPGQTMSLAWSPARPGNWLFHCHLGFHMIPESARLVPPGEHDRASGDVRKHMAGLVLGISVRAPAAYTAPAEGPARRIRMLVQESPRRRGRAPRAMGYVWQDGPTEPALDSADVPGRPLVLTRGVPVEILVTNRLAEPTAVHWHGLEIESYWDGVAGWSGSGERVAPVIPPGGSFTAKLRLPRAGTYMYHSHLNEGEELTSGLYGPIVVLEPGQRFDPATDHVYIAGWDGLDDPPHLVVNGDSLPPPLELAVGVAHRFRFANIGMAWQFEFSIVRDSLAMTWRPLAKDGADLPAWQSTPGPSRFALAVGETFDAEFRPPAPGVYQLVVRPPGEKVWWSQRLIVK